jgi:hypothetical protein
MNLRKRFVAKCFGKLRGKISKNDISVSEVIPELKKLQNEKLLIIPHPLSLGSLNRAGTNGLGETTNAYKILELLMEINYLQVVGVYGRILLKCIQRWAMGEWSEIPVTAQPGNFFLYLRVRRGSKAHPASYPTGTKCSLLGDKAAGA